MSARENTATSKRRQVGKAEQNFRERAGISIEAAAELIDVTMRTMYRVESGQAPLDKAKIMLLSAEYGLTDDERAAWLEMARQIRGQRGQYPAFMPLKAKTFTDLQHDASEILVATIDVLPELFHTEDYMRAIWRDSGSSATPELLDELVAVRKATQSLLTAEEPPIVRVIVHELALRIPVGGPAVMHEQLRRLEHLCDLPQVEIQVQTTDEGAYPGMGSGFVLLGFDKDPNGDMVRVESIGDVFYRDRPAATRPYRMVFSRKRASALSFAASRVLITSMADRFGRVSAP